MQKFGKNDMGLVSYKEGIVVYMWNLIPSIGQQFVAFGYPVTFLGWDKETIVSSQLRKC